VAYVISGYISRIFKNYGKREKEREKERERERERESCIKKRLHCRVCVAMLFVRKEDSDSVLIAFKLGGERNLKKS